MVMLVQKKRIGIMGGTFDPIHYGHLVTAEAAQHRFALDQVIFVPSGRPPHKLTHRLTPAAERLLMTLLATVPNQNFVVSDWEEKREQISYTYDTVLAFHQQFGDEAELFFITGADAVLEIMQWRRIDELTDFCSFIAATRPGYHLDNFQASPKLTAKLFFMEVPALAISSSDIRRRVAHGEPIKYLLPETVEMYIYKHGLYKEEII